MNIFIDSIWFNDIGIVCYKNSIGEIKFVIGKGGGFNQKQDEQFIIDWGTKFDPDQVIEFFETHYENLIFLLNKKANEIYSNISLTWKQKFDLIFSDEISQKVFDLINLDYYCPDTSYEEDVIAFMDAFNKYIDEHPKNTTD